MTDGAEPARLHPNLAPCWLRNLRDSQSVVVVAGLVVIALAVVLGLLWPLISADLTHADLTEADLSGARLGDADFTVANLSGANLTRANLRLAGLVGANLTDADIIRNR
jgi:uncharacterized protein YjbI with pentapeptide repeats